MHLSELDIVTDHSVWQTLPTWMLGAFQRRSISFSNGLSDTRTRVFWFQSPNLTIDLRLPTLNDQIHSETLIKKADYECWYGYPIWDGKQLQWEVATSYQTDNRWPEPALLQRTGNCMIEFAPSGIYVEDWRLLSDETGPLIGLELLTETDLSTGETRSRQGALIICGQYAAMTLARPIPLSNEQKTLKDQLQSPHLSEEEKINLLDFETSVAQGSIKDDFLVQHSLHQTRIDEPLLSLSGFELEPETGFVKQTTQVDGKDVMRIFKVDCFDLHFPLTASTPATKQSTDWFDAQSTTLKRYTQRLYLDNESNEYTPR